MDFEINDSQELVAKQNGPIQLDKRVPIEEVHALEKALEGGKDHIYDATGKNLAKLLHEDILVNDNLSKFSPEVQEDLLALAEKHPHKNIDLDLTIPKELQDTMDQEDLQLSMNQAIEGVENFVDTSMRLPADSDLSTTEHGEIVWILSEIVQDNIGGINKVVQDKIKENPDYSLGELRWIINGAIKDYLSTLKDEVIVPMQQLIKFSSPSMRENTVYAEIHGVHERQADTQGLEGEEKIQYVERMSAADIEQFDFQYGRLQTELLSGSMDSSNFKREFDLLFGNNSGLTGETFMSKKKSTDDSLDISLLSEADKKIESQAMLYFLCAVGFQCIPYIGAAPGTAIGVQDMFTSEDATMTWLKNAGLVPQEYHMEKTWVDNLASGIGVGLSVIGLQAAAKTGKLAKALGKIQGISGSDISGAIASFTQKMGVAGGRVEKTLQSLMGLKGDNTITVSNTNIAPGKTEVSEAQTISYSESTPNTQTRGEIPVAENDNIASLNRSIRHTPESYIKAGGRSNEYGFVDKNGQLHINTDAFSKLPQAEKTSMMKEFIAHERAHQAILNLEKGSLLKIQESFMQNNIFIVTSPDKAAKYGLHFDRAMSPLDTTNEILAHMIGRMRVGKDVPDNFIKALNEAGIHDISGTFGINNSRDTWNKVGGVTNYDKLNEAAMSTQGTQDVFNLGKYAINQLKSNPEIIELINSFHASGPNTNGPNINIGTVLAKIDFTDKYVDSAINIVKGHFNALLSSKDIAKISDYLASEGKNFPDGLDLNEINDYGSAGVTDEFFDNLIGTLKEIRAGEKINSDPLKMRSEELIEHTLKIFGNNRTDISAYIGENTDIINAVQKLKNADYHDISFLENDLIKIKDFYDRFGKEATEKMITDVYGIEDVEMQKLFANIDQYDAIIGQASKKVTPVEDRIFGQRSGEINTYIQDTPELSDAITALENPDYHDINFLHTHIFVISDFVQKFGEDATTKMITEIFKIPNIDLSKLFTNIKRYDDAIKLAEQTKIKKGTNILKGVGIPHPTQNMIEQLEKIEAFKSNEDWFDGSSTDIAYFVGREIGPSGLYIELGKEKFINLLQDLGINIPIDKQDNFFETIEGLSGFNIAKSASDIEISRVINTRSKIGEKIKQLRGKSLNKSTLLSTLKSDAPKAAKYLDTIDVGFIYHGNEMLIINGENISAIKKVNITPELELSLSEGNIPELVDHEINDNDFSVTMITFLENA